MKHPLSYRSPADDRPNTGPPLDRWKTTAVAIFVGFPILLLVFGFKFLFW